MESTLQQQLRDAPCPAWCAQSPAVDARPLTSNGARMRTRISWRDASHETQMLDAVVKQLLPRGTSLAAHKMDRRDPR